jgi:hypothetical protein
VSKRIKVIIILFVGLLVLIQFYPLDRSNPPVTAEIETPYEVKVVLKKSCYDCHSNETVWPFYAHIAPVSWLVVRDVHKARHDINFSEWGNLPQDKQYKKLDKMWEEIEEEKMPLPIYLITHPSAKLSDEQKATIKNWIESSIPDIQ